MNLSIENFEFLRQLMRDQVAISLDDDKVYFATARLCRLARETSGGSLNQLVSSARDFGGPLRRDVVEALTVNETSFFRDPLLSDCMTNMALPQLLARRRDTRTLRIWSAACSSGQEPYSLAILLRERFPELADWHVEFIASDYSRAMLTKARAGTYTTGEVNRGLPARTLMKWFTQHDLDWHVHPSLRQAIDFREINLIGQWPNLPTFDIVLLRNVMIYFAPPVRRLLLSRIRAQMARDGYLLLGATETIEPDAGFVTALPGNHRPCYCPDIRRYPR